MVTYRGQVRAASMTARKEKMEREKAVVEGMKEGAKKNPSSGSSKSGSVEYGFLSRRSN